jgi:ABC-2 type transport system permease protein
MRNMGAATLTQFAIFFTIFLSTSQVPLSNMAGWLHAVARVNPMTNVLRLARQGLLGDVTWNGTWGGLVALAGMLFLSTWFALSGLRSLEK